MVTGLGEIFMLLHVLHILWSPGGSNYSSPGLNLGPFESFSSSLLLKIKEAFGVCFFNTEKQAHIIIPSTKLLFLETDNLTCDR